MSIKAVKHHLSAPLLAGSLYQEQLATETQAVEAGVRRYRQLADESIRRGEGASLKPAERLCQYWFNTITDFFRKEIDESIAGEAGLNRSITTPLLRQLDPEVLAVITMHEGLSACMRADTEDGIPVAAIAYTLGSAVFAQLHLLTGKKDAKESLRELEFRTRALSVSKVNWWAKRNLSNPETSRKTAVMLGTVMLAQLTDGALIHTDEEPIHAFEQIMVRKKHKTVNHFRMTREAWDVLDNGHAIRETLRPRYLPMVVEPFPWQEKAKDKPRTEGGYVRIRTPLVSKPTPAQKDALEAADLTETFECLNTLGTVPMSINKFVLGIQQEIWRTGGGELGIPRHDDEPKPPKPSDFDSLTAEQKKPWKRLAVEAHRRNVAARGVRVGYLKAMSVAEQFAKAEAIYFPHQLDYRGRAYPIPAHLNHQSNDVRASLLQFGKPAQAESLRWLMIHAANTYGMDKVSYRERYEWAGDHIKQIHECGSKPLDTDFWHHADESRPGAKDGKPWQFLAACRAIVSPEAGARLPVGIDGTANGLQHYTAITRDASVAPMVNMTPSTEDDTPNGAYLRIVDAVKIIASKDLEADDGRVITFERKGVQTSMLVRDVARAAMLYISKATVKQPFMTKFYNVTPTGARKQVQGVLKEAGVGEEWRYPIARYMADAILNGVKNVCAGADGAMDWMCVCARMIAEKGRPVSWKTRLGFPVVQPYRLLSLVRVNTLLGNLTLRINDDALPVSLRRQVDGTPPNFIHSVDQTHMHMTARECRREGVDFLATHDRYFAHAAHMPRLIHHTRSQFVKLHEPDLLVDLWKQWQGQHIDIDFPPPLDRGTFDINDVLQSTYFFS